jgi:hypothetical protein
MDMATDRKNASKAGKLLSTSKSPTVRSVAGSDLAQAKRGTFLTNKPVTKHASITQSQATKAVREYRGSHGSKK